MKAVINMCTVNGSYSDLVGSTITIKNKIKLWYFDWYLTGEYGDLPILCDDCMPIHTFPKEYILTETLTKEIPN